MRREILRLAVPAFLALVAEPLFLLADSAIVGHLGTEPLAGLSVASAVLLTAAGVFVFLAYGTTSVVARRLGAGDLPGALGAGVDGLWLAVVLGAVTALGVAVGGARPLRGVRGVGRGAGAGRDLPADLGPRPTGHARRPRRDRAAAGAAGHADAARRGRRRVRAQHRPQPAAGLRRRASASPAPPSGPSSPRRGWPWPSSCAWCGRPGRSGRRCGRTPPGSCGRPSAGCRCSCGPSRYVGSSS